MEIILDNYGIIYKNDHINYNDQILKIRSHFMRRENDVMIYDNLENLLS